MEEIFKNVDISIIMCIIGIGVFAFIITKTVKSINEDEKRKESARIEEEKEKNRNYDCELLLDTLEIADKNYKFYEDGLSLISENRKTGERIVKKFSDHRSKYDHINGMLWTLRLKVRSKLNNTKVVDG